MVTFVLRVSGPEKSVWLCGIWGEWSLYCWYCNKHGWRQLGHFIISLSAIYAVLGRELVLVSFDMQLLPGDKVGGSQVLQELCGSKLFNVLWFFVHIKCDSLSSSMWPFYAFSLLPGLLRHAWCPIDFWRISRRIYKGMVVRIYCEMIKAIISVGYLLILWQQCN